MTYEKPEVEVVKFESEGFMTGSQVTYASATDAAAQNCTGFSGTAQKFTCEVFGDGKTGTYGGYTYYHNGNHWHCHGVK